MKKLYPKQPATLVAKNTAVGLPLGEAPSNPHRWLAEPSLNPEKRT